MLCIKRNVQFVLIMLCMIVSTQVIYAAPKISNGLTFDWVGEGGTLDARYNHMSYIPVKITASTDYYVQNIDIKLGGTISKYVSLCDKDHCGYAPIGEPQTVTVCDTSGSHTTNLSPNQSCFIWLQVKNQDGTLPFVEPNEQVNVTINTKECQGDPACSSPSSVTYPLKLTMDVNNSVYAGGEHGIYAYNGEWNKLASINAISGSSKVTTATFFDGDLYFGGNFSINSSNLYFTKWNGVQFNNDTFSQNNPVWTTKVYQTTYPATVSQLSIGGDLNGYFSTWDGSYWGKFMINSPVYTIDSMIGNYDQILGTEYNDYAQSGVIEYLRSEDILPTTMSVRLNYMPVNQIYNASSMLYSYSQSGERDIMTFCIGSVTKNGNRAALECDQDNEYIPGALNYISNQVFSVNSSQCADTYAGVKYLGKNSQMNTMFAAGCMDQLYDHKSKVFPANNIVYAQLDAVFNEKEPDTPWKVLPPSGVNKDVFAMLEDGPYEFVAGAFTKTGDNTNMGPVAYFVLENNLPTWINLNFPFQNEVIHSLALDPSINRVKLTKS